MRSLLITLCFLTFLATPVYLLECFECHGSNAGDCEGSFVTCSNSEHVCVSWHQEERNVQRTYFNRLCGNKDVCGFSATYGSYYGRLRERITCCSEDRCTPDFPELPAGNTEKNGLVCPMCNDHSDCNVNYGIYCIGDEHYCFHATYTSTADQETWESSDRGCGTKSICDINTLNTGDENYQNTIKVECSGGTRLQIYSAFIFLVLAVVWVI